MRILGAHLLLLLLLTACSCPATIEAFQTAVPVSLALNNILGTSSKTDFQGAPCARTPRALSTTRLWAASNTATNKKSTLTDETVWKISVVLRSVETVQGKRVNEMLTLNVNFMEEFGYEPPQGTIQQILRGENQVDRLLITNGRWKLSEDPNDRKDGLWVWGLFKEPLYPFMLLQIETQAIPLPGRGSGRSKSDNGGDEEKIDAIKPLTLYAQINHKRDDKLGVVLQAASDLNVRQVETIKADPFGAAKVDIYEDVSVGTITIQPIN